MSLGATYPARLATTSQLERLSDKARELELGQAGNQRLWDESNRAMAHIGYAVSAERMVGLQAAPGEGTVWPLTNGQEALVVAWWVRMRPDSTVPAPVFPLIFCMTPGDYTALDRTAIDEAMLAEAHELAAEFLTAADLWPPKEAPS